MVTTEVRDMAERDLPDEIEYFIIGEDGALVGSPTPIAKVYIDEFQMQWLTNKEAMLYIREHYGAHIGVMRKVVFPVRPQKRRTTKMLLGVVKTEE